MPSWKNADGRSASSSRENGAGRAAAQAHADKLGLRRCHWKDYAPKDGLLPTLLAARVFVVTQRPETRGLL